MSTIVDQHEHPKSSQCSLLLAHLGLQYEFAVQVGLHNCDKRGNPEERTDPLAGSPSFTFSLWCRTNKVVFMNNKQNKLQETELAMKKVDLEEIIEQVKEFRYLGSLISD